MKKVFLIDDEKVIRQGIASSIEWQKEGFIYCGDAQDGELALPLIEKHQPDIVITDIKMPFMDGLQLSRVLRENMPWIKIIILSGHDEFEYAQEAVRIQVSEYCLKPLDSADLLSILHKVSLQIDEELKAKQQLNELKNQALKHVSISQNNFLQELCEGIHTAADAIKLASQLKLELASSHYYLLIIEWVRKNIDLTNWIQENYSCLTYNRNENESIYIMKGNSKQQLENESKAIREKLLLESGSLIFGFGKIKNRIQGIAESFEEATTMKNHSAPIDSGITMKNPTLIGNINSDLHLINRNELIFFLKYGQSDRLADFCKKYSSYLESTAILTPFIIYYFIMDFTITVLQYVKEQDSPSSKIIEEISLIEMKAGSINEYSEILEYMESVLHLYLQYRNQTNSKFSSIIQQVKDYVEEQYSDSSLSLQLIAKKVNVSASYLSHMFSQETGETLIEYLTKTRIERAKELLKTTNDKTFEIAHKVGYSDSHYFCHSFKKMTGMTTKQFRLHDVMMS
ncbi:response regulator transcription factor [Bacillus suaedae]|uniref:Response regulator n=1 Tax=Halalkalibacter suaedae TaxID=2822140 RepID=A0A940WUT3_9BACI|nr:response regulator [Bacillus suaedae]MBP3950872.1 response regulator [Bacillus suaedae]